MTYRKRIVDELLARKLRGKGAVLIEGPKWCGKTTTAEQQAASVIYMDDPVTKDQNILMSQINPKRLLAGPAPRLIDEWQLAPKLWDATRFEVDHRGHLGQFILTGSSVPPSTAEIVHSGTGRFGFLMMRTMSLFETGDSNGQVSLKELFEGAKDIDGVSDIDDERLAFLVCRGGWPQSIDMEMDVALDQGRDYLRSVVRFDVNRVDGITKAEDKVTRLLRSYARNQGCQVPNTLLAKDIGSSDETVASYLNALNRLFVIDDMPAWNPNLRSKTAIRSTPTRYFGDSSLACAALRLGPNDLVNDSKTFGFMLKTLCVHDLRVYADSLDGEVFHYRDKEGLECDAVIHLRNGKYGLVEIKLGADSLVEEGASNLLRLADKIDVSTMNSPSFLMVLVGIGHYAYRRPDGVLVVPINCLRN